ncbi:MAG: DNA polymerase III subunit epsilon, partial [Magnetococcales bacterium]|nr:DNA polymerase III subunit epsilon [Magnetococcales bacterium]
MSSWVSILDMRRRYLLNRAPPGTMRDYLSVPFPSGRTPCDSVP